MADSLNKLWLKGQAEEDIYIAKLEREQNKAKKKKKLRGKVEDSVNKKPGQDKQ
ncbi:MAG: hypothetical protein ABW098_16615 [Candidatus Thiodiazotropha sp.]